ncbi:phage virion morphogenesis protein [Rhodobacter capsulatus]|uniref:Phage virion morphogenesis (Putative tail completion) protein n=1 Tax=Rhodobacter capsulatus TaxID=1061 RepID=A0A1G7SEK4_RHOCA|nr:phage virion morphogenesis protein [Rhodobacter capsulatus]SDG21391.1 phage virion morphogenesis (putative tail completion) protein [Rhodobacter capsulatus]
MVGTAVEIIEQGLAEALARIERLSALDRHELMDTIGRLAQLQTRQRIEVEKTAPDGTPWAKTWRGSSILFNTGTLADSIDYLSNQHEVRVGSALVYARIHQFGGTIKPKNKKALSFAVPGGLRKAMPGGSEKVFLKSVTIPARPYLGLSADNIAEAEEVIAEFIEGLLQ